MKLFALALLCALSAQAKQSLEVLVRVAERSVTDRQVWIDLFLDDVDVYKKAHAEGRGSAAFEQGLQRVITQIVVDEENRILGTVNARNDEVNARLNEIKRKKPQDYAKFLQDWDAREKEIKEVITRKILLQKIIESKIELALASYTGKDPKERERLSTDAVDVWFQQLRARYPVKFLASPEKTPKK